MTEKTRKPGREGDFLSRWSERKRAGAPVAEPVAEVVPEVAAEAVISDAPEKTDEEMLEELGLPAPEELQPGDDFSGFMAKAVPERLRNRALRRLWLTNPVLANLDELVDYGEDFTDAATVIENLQTVYRVGKGMLPDPVPDETLPEDAHEVAPESALAADAEEAQGDGDADAVDAQVPPDDLAESDSTDAPPAESTAQIPHAEMEAAAPTVPRRMRFRFEG